MYDFRVATLVFSVTGSAWLVFFHAAVIAGASFKVFAHFLVTVLAQFVLGRSIGDDMAISAVVLQLCMAAYDLSRHQYRFQGSGKAQTGR